MAVADDLYALAPDEFTAARDLAARRARDGGDREAAATIKAFRRPSIGAWLVNQLVRTHPDEVDELLELGAALRDAQDALDGAELRALSAQRHQVIRGLSDLSRRVASDRGQKIGDAAQREFEATFDAALADGSAAEAVRTGRLMRALEPSGLDPVDLDGAVASPQDVPPPRRRTAKQATPRKDVRAGKAGKAAQAKAAKAKANAERAERLARAEAELEAAEHTLREHHDRLAQARDAEAGAKQDVADLEARLEDARESLTSAHTRRRDAEQAQKRAARSRDAARRTVETTRRSRE